jgi:hypothetical protein
MAQILFKGRGVAQACHHRAAIGIGGASRGIDRASGLGHLP